MSDAPRRPMKYPYTLGAKIAQFPFKLYYEHAWLTKYYLLGVLVCVPIFYKIQKLSYSPDNVAKWREIDRKTFSGENH